MDVHRSDIRLMYKKTCSCFFCLKLDVGWTSKMVVIHSCGGGPFIMSKIGWIALATFLNPLFPHESAEKIKIIKFFESWEVAHSTSLKMSIFRPLLTHLGQNLTILGPLRIQKLWGSKNLRKNCFYFQIWNSDHIHDHQCQTRSPWKVFVGLKTWK